MLMPLMAYAQNNSHDEEIFRERYPWKHEFRIGYGGAPVLDMNEHFHSSSVYMYDVDISPERNTLTNIYGEKHGSEYVTGVFSAEYSIHLRRWFSFVAYAGINGMWGKKYDPASDTEFDCIRGVSVQIIPAARFQWVNSKYVRMYTTVGVGVYMGTYGGNYVFYPAAYTTPIGISVGRQIFFYAETSLSTASMGGNFGIGYRF